jgi:membrane-bound metal-dependent hydrolase YbcI (DUF457 family)
MDNITHSLFGATLARTPLGRVGRGSTAALVLASNAPDIDIVATAGGSLKYLEWHRGPTHGPLGVVVLGLVTAALVYGGRQLIDRRNGRRPSNGGAPKNASYLQLAAIAILGVLFHVLMDLPTSYGTHLLSPFDWHWYAFDWMPIVDIYLLGALATGLLIGQRWPTLRQRNAVIVLIFMLGNYGARLVAHERAIALAPRVFGPALPARCEGSPEHRVLDRWPLPEIALPESSTRCVLEIAALPDFGSLFRWRVVARLSNAYLVRDIDVLDARLRSSPSPTDALWRLTTTYPNHWPPQAFEAAQTAPVKAFLGFSRLPAVRWAVDPHGVTTVSWRDLRFAAPPGVRRVSPRLEPDRERPGPNLFGATVRIDSKGEVLDARLGVGE